MDTIDKINFFLAKNGKTGADLSRALSLSNGTYSQWNTKKTRPSKKLLPEISSFLSVPVEDILPDPEIQVDEQAELLPDNQNKIIVENIRRIASGANTNVSKIEKALGFANGTIGKWANGHKSPPFDKLSRISEHLHVPLAELTDTPIPPAEHDPGIKNPPAEAGGEEEPSMELFEELFGKLPKSELWKVAALATTMAAAASEEE